MAIYDGKEKTRWHFKGNHRIKQVYQGNVLIYSTGAMVTYHVDTTVQYSEEVESGQSCLSPSTFTPTKSGYTFLGWRQDTTANNTVLTSLVMGDEPVHLYAVFQKTVTVTYYATSDTAATRSGTQYYNNGNINNPTISISDPTLSGWTFQGWCTSTSATASTAYASLSGGVAFSESVTLYGKFSCTVTLTYYATSSSSSTTSGTRYFNASGTYSNPTFTISNPSLSGWTFLGWGTSTSATASVAYSSISGTSFSANTTLYGLFSCTITLSYNGNSSTSGSTASQTGTRYFNAYGNYSNPSFTLASNGFTRTNYTWYAWAQGSSSGTQYAKGASVTLTANTTFYACWTATATNFSYTGGVQSYTTPCAGTYKFEVYGAAGGAGSRSSYTVSASKGGYAYGSITLSKGTTVYICVGGAGTWTTSSSGASGGYNGGGATGVCSSSRAAGSGGGATSITKTNAVLKSCSSSNVYIVGGGGGGGAASDGTAKGGDGGGSSGGDGAGYYTDTSSVSYTAGGGTQSGGGSAGYGANKGGFGYGGDGCWPGSSTVYAGAGGGGGYYGGGGGSQQGGAGGGSGYTGGMSSSTGMTNGSRSGNGYATITITAVS